MLEALFTVTNPHSMFELRHSLVPYVGFIKAFGVQEERGLTRTYLRTKKKPSPNTSCHSPCGVVMLLAVPLGFKQ